MSAWRLLEAYETRNAVAAERGQEACQQATTSTLDTFWYQAVRCGVSQQVLSGLSKAYGDLQALGLSKRQSSRMLCPSRLLAWRSDGWLGLQFAPADLCIALTVIAQSMRL